MSDKPVTGTDAIRSALRARKLSRALIARDIGVPSDDLETFANSSSAKLAPEILQRLASHLFAGSAEYLPELDRLRSTNRAEPLPMGIAPAPFVPTPGPVHAGPVAAQTGYPQPSPPKTRPGWVT
jgi:hypothetical protein